MKRRQYDREWKRNNRALLTLLALVDIEWTPAAVEALTDEQARDAEWWAGHEHLSASDNGNRRYPKPEFLPESGTDKRIRFWSAKTKPAEGATDGR